MKQLITLFLLIFHFQLCAQDSLIFLKMELNVEIFEIEAPISSDYFSSENEKSIHRYTYREIKLTPLLAKKIVTNNDVYELNLGFEKYLDARTLFKDEAYTFWEKPDYYDFSNYNFYTSLGYQKSHDFFFRLNKNTALVSQSFPREEYLRTSIASRISKNDVHMYLNFSYSNEIYFENFNRPSSYFGSRVDFDFPKSFAEQRFVEWTAIRFPLSNIPFENLARMNLNMVLNPFGKALLKFDVTSNFIFLKDGRQRFRTFTFGVGAEASEATRIFINGTRATNQIETLPSFYNLKKTILTLNLRQRLSRKNL